jgi:hypothetical protein
MKTANRSTHQFFIQRGTQALDFSPLRVHQRVPFPLVLLATDTCCHLYRSHSFALHGAGESESHLLISSSGEKTYSFHFHPFTLSISFCQPDPISSSFEQVILLWRSCSVIFLLALRPFCRSKLLDDPTCPIVSS